MRYRPRCWDCEWKARWLVTKKLAINKAMDHKEASGHRVSLTLPGEFVPTAIQRREGAEHPRLTLMAPEEPLNVWVAAIDCASTRGPVWSGTTADGEEMARHRHVEKLIDVHQLACGQCDLTELRERYGSAPSVYKAPTTEGEE